MNSSNKGEVRSSKTFNNTVTTIGALSTMAGAIVFGILAGIAGFLYATFYIIKQAFTYSKGEK